MLQPCHKLQQGMDFCPIVGIPLIPIMGSLCYYTLFILPKNNKATGTNFTGCTSIKKGLDVGVVNHYVRESSGGYRVNYSDRYMFKRGQGYNFVTCLREFGASSLKQFSPHLLGLVTNIVGN